MSDQPEKKEGQTPTAFSAQIGAKAERKLEAQRKINKTIWFGFGWFGLVGWSVAVPTLLGTLLGLWLDSKYPGPHSWTLMLLVAGLVTGCWNAWHWVASEDAQIHGNRENKDE